MHKKVTKIIDLKLRRKFQRERERALKYWQMESSVDQGRTTSIVDGKWGIDPSPSTCPT